MEWKPIHELNDMPPLTEVLAVNNKTGEMQMTQRDDFDCRRGFNHRNGFNQATHFLANVPAYPPYQCPHAVLENWMNFCPVCGEKIKDSEEGQADEG